MASIKETETRIVGISPDSSETLKKFSAENGIHFLLLSDPGSKTIKAYKLLASRGLPHPGTILIDKSGIIRAKLFRDGYRARHSNEELIGIAKGIP